MIKFFRKIRQNLLMENKTSKYFKYAIGEIILVVIGILIALQINNWNENRIKKMGVQSALTQILSDLEQDINVLDLFKNQEKNHVSYLSKISDKQFQYIVLDTIINCLDNYMNASLTNNGYASLKDSGKITDIDNPDLKVALTNYYERANNKLIAANSFAEHFTNNRVVPYIINHLKPDKDAKINSDLIKEKLKDDKLQSIVNYQINVKKYSLKTLSNLLEQNSNLAVDIRLELKSKN